MLNFQGAEIESPENLRVAGEKPQSDSQAHLCKFIECVSRRFTLKFIEPVGKRCLQFKLDKDFADKECERKKKYAQTFLDLAIFFVIF